MGCGVQLFGGNTPPLVRQNSISSQRQTADARPMQTLTLLPSHSGLHLIITPLQRPFVISVRCRFPHPTPLFSQNAQKKGKWRFITLIFHTLWPCQWGNIQAITLMNSRLTLHRVNTTAPGWTFFLKRWDTGVFKTHIHPYQSGRLATCIKAATPGCKDI